MLYKLLVINLFVIVLGTFRQKLEPENRMDLKRFTPDPTCNRRIINFGNLKIVPNPSGKGNRLAGKVRLMQDIGKLVTMESRLVKNVRGRGSTEVASQTSTICTDPADANKLWPLSVVPSYSKCPIRKGVFSVQNFTVAKFMLKYMPLENYIIEANVSRNGVKFCGATLEFDVVND